VTRSHRHRQDKLAAASPSCGGRGRESNKTRRGISRYAQIDSVFARVQEKTSNALLAKCMRHRWVKPRGRNKRERVSQSFRSFDASPILQLSCGKQVAHRTRCSLTCSRQSFLPSAFIRRFETSWAGWLPTIGRWSISGRRDSWIATGNLWRSFRLLSIQPAPLPQRWNIRRAVVRTLFCRGSGNQFLEARIVAQWIKHRIQPEQRGSERRVCGQRRFVRDRKQFS